MPDRQQHIVQLEKDANLLVEEIKNLKKEVTSYRMAAGELTKTRESLIAFLEETQKLTQQSHKLLATLNEIGTARIFEELHAIKDTAESNRHKAKAANVLIIVGTVTVVILQIWLLVKLHMPG